MRILAQMGGGLRDAQIMDTAAVGVAQKEDREEGIHEQDIFDSVVFLLPAITLLLLNRVLGADDASFRPVMGKRGASGATAGTAISGTAASSSGATRVAVAASATPRVPIFHDATALDTAIDVLDADAAACNAPIGGFLRPRERPAPRLLGGHDDLDVVEREGQEAEILEQPAARGQRIWRGLGNPLVVSAARIGVAQEEDR